MKVKRQRGRRIRSGCKEKQGRIFQTGKQTSGTISPYTMGALGGGDHEGEGGVHSKELEKKIKAKWGKRNGKFFREGPWREKNKKGRRKRKEFGRNVFAGI